MRRRHLLRAALVLGLTGGGASFWLLLLGPLRGHRRWSDRVRGAILALLGRRPPEVGPGPWEFAVGWTYKLHANCGSDRSLVTNWARADRFVDDLDRRLEGAVGLDTLDWVWDEYEGFSKYGQRYSDLYRPTRSPDLPTAQPGCFGGLPSR